MYTIERIKELVDSASAALAATGYDNVHVVHGDGTLGWADHAPFDVIVVTAGGPSVPESLKQQLEIGGRLVIPVGVGQELQELVRVTRLSETEFKLENLVAVRFVPLVGAEGWDT